MSRGGNYKNPCLTMHQPWASLLVHGIKRIEGRSWPCPIRGRLWIHAASKIPDEDTIKAMEDFYREIYAVDGISDIRFPQHYPVSRLIGCVDVVGCVTSDELRNWDAELPQGVRLEGQTDFCWLCEKPQKLIIPFEMRGFQGVYNLENKVHVAAARGLTPCQNSFTVKFPVLDPKDMFSLKPGSVPCTIQEKEKKALEIEQDTSLAAAIVGAKAAATQFSKRGQSLQTNDYTTRSTRKATEKDAEPIDNPVLGPYSSTRSTSKATEKDAEPRDNTVLGPYNTRRTTSKAAKNEGEPLDNNRVLSTFNTRSVRVSEEGCSGNSSRAEDDAKSIVTKRQERNTSVGERRFDPGTARIMAAAIRNLKPSS